MKTKISNLSAPISANPTRTIPNRNAIHWSATASIIIINLVATLDYWINQEPMVVVVAMQFQLHPVRLSIQFMNIRKKKWPLPNSISIVVAIIYGKCVQNTNSLTDIRQMHGNFSFHPVMVLHGAMYSKRPAQHGCTISTYWASVHSVCIVHIIFTFIILC